ncbi:MAG: L,D-transpeptidase family protein, partial [Ruminococcus sp.]|nr:L,D-transpeptidase family protein [Ruminococcus sp.]
KMPADGVQSRRRSLCGVAIRQNRTKNACEKGTITLYNKDQEFSPNTDASASSPKAPVQLTKDEMRQKIRASLAARNAADESGQDAPTPACTAAGASASASNRAHMDKMRQLRDTMASQHAENPTAAPRRIESSTNRTRQPQPQNPPGYTPMRTSHYDRGSAAPSRNFAKFSIILSVILVLVLALFYFGGLLLYRGKYLPNTYVNSVNISGMTEEEAENAIIDTAQEMGVTFVTSNGEEIVFKGSSFGCKFTIPENAMDAVNAESHAAWFVKLFSTSQYDITLDQTYSEDDLVSLIAAYDWGNIPPTDASIQEDENGTFYIEPEDNGNMVDTEILSDYTLEQLRSGSNTIYMAMNGCYMEASVTAESLEETLDLYTKYGSVEITYDMTNREEMFDPVGTVVLGHETYLDWITFEGDTLVLDKEEAAAWVEEYIVEPYDTFCSDGYTRTFQSTMDGVVQLTLTETSTYGWQTDVDATVDMLEQYLQDGESVTVESEYVQAGFRPQTSSGVTFDERTYIEVDICNQHLWFYVDGELYLDSDVVTGLASDPERATKTGVFKIRDKIKDAVLGTYEVQGYETSVSYWMPIDHTGVGLHDLSRSAYGGDIYLTNGSHGCINLPLDVAEKIFEKTVIGMPVIIID